MLPSSTLENSGTRSDESRVIGARHFAKLSLAFVSVAIAAAVACPLTMSFDKSVSSYLRQMDLPGDLQKAISLSEAFAHGFGVFVIMLSVFVIASDKRRLVLIAILITAISGVTANVLKATVVRVRPHAEGLQVVGVGDAQSTANDAVERSFWDSRQRSFPSGHSATAWGLAIGLSLIFWRGWWIFSLLATLACVQRIESGAHFPSDVLAGMAIAFLLAACVVQLPGVRRQLQAHYSS